MENASHTFIPYSPRIQTQASTPIPGHLSAKYATPTSRSARECSTRVSVTCCGTERESTRKRSDRARDKHITMVVVVMVFFIVSVCVSCDGTNFVVLAVRRRYSCYRRRGPPFVFRLSRRMATFYTILKWVCVTHTRTQSVSCSEFFSPCSVGLSLPHFHAHFLLCNDDELSRFWSCHVVVVPSQPSDTFLDCNFGPTHRAPHHHTLVTFCAVNYGQYSSSNLLGFSSFFFLHISFIVVKYLNLHFQWANA